MRLGARTNLALLVLLGVAFVTGWLAFALATNSSRWSLVLHATSGVAILLLLPWKSMIAKRGLNRPRAGRWASVLLAAFVLVSLAAGLAHSTGALVYAGPVTAMEVHVGAAIAALPFAAWHVLARRIRLRRADMSRRNFLKGGLVVTGAAAVYGLSELGVRAAGLAGRERRFTGSYEAGSFRPELMPVSSWMFDAIPHIEAATWRLKSAAGLITYDELLSFDDSITATLDCTGGFYSTQDWSGVRLDRILSGAGGASIRIVSHTGYDRRFPYEEASRLLLATRFGGRPLDPGHGFPARVVAPNRRGFWWVKWVTAIEVDEAPYWWQPPFPLQ